MFPLNNLLVRIRHLGSETNVYISKGLQYTFTRVNGEIETRKLVRHGDKDKINFLESLKTKKKDKDDDDDDNISIELQFL